MLIDHAQWEVCGVTPSSTNIPPAVTTEASQHASHSNSAGPAGSSDEPRGGHLRTAKHSGAHVLSTSASGSASTAGDSSAAVNSAHSVTSPGGATKGYTCGLWFLFHYLSGLCATRAAQMSTCAAFLICLSHSYVITLQWPPKAPQHSRLSRPWPSRRAFMPL